MANNVDTINKGEYSNNEIIIYNYLRSILKYWIAPSCGVLAVIEKISGFDPKHEYRDSEGNLYYGLLGLNLERKNKLITYCGKNKDPGTVKNQLDYLLSEIEDSKLNNKYRDVSNSIKAITNNAVEAGNASTLAWRFSDIPTTSYSNDEISEVYYRAKDMYYPHYWEYDKSVRDNDPVSLRENIAAIAISLCNVPTEYKVGGKGEVDYQTGKMLFDAPGLVYYCCKMAGYPIPDLSAKAMCGAEGKSNFKVIEIPYNYHLKDDGDYIDVDPDHKDWEKSDSKEFPKENRPRVGDLIGYQYGTGSWTVAIVVDPEGKGAVEGYDHVNVVTADTEWVYPDHKVRGDDWMIRVEAKSDDEAYIELEEDYVIRIIPDNITEDVQVETPLKEGTSSSPSVYVEAAASDIYKKDISKNLLYAIGDKFRLGYLIAIDRDDEFKFYIPEFEESAGAMWSDVNIIGRSVNILSYSHTNSRSISVNLDLYAGVGLYEGDSLSESVDRLHRDINILKSFEYPDYTNPITRPPTPVHLILGSSINIIGVVSGVTVTHMKPLDSNNRSMYVKVGFKVTQITDNPPDCTDIKYGRHALAVANTL